jgi:hypothetical protein
MSAVVLVSPAVHRRRLVDLDTQPDALARPGRLRLDPSVPVDPGADADLAVPLAAARYLLTQSVPAVQLVAGRVSPTEPDWRRPARYRDVPQRWLALLQRARIERGAVPRWLQVLLVGQLVRYLEADAALYTTTATLPDELTAEFHDALAALLACVDDDVVAGFPADDEIRLALLLGVPGRAGHLAPRTRTDTGRQLTRISYLFAGPAPAERYTRAGEPLSPQFGKTRSIAFYGRALLHERIAWLPAGADVHLDRAAEVGLAPAPRERRWARYRRVSAENTGVARRIGADLIVRARARDRAAAAEYRDAWLLMDRDTAAGDNAEHLYRYLRAQHPEINAWFVLGRDSPDWSRLSADGFRLLDYGSPAHLVALLHCVHLVSSQIDSYVVKPFRKHLLGPGRWRYTFLQHGVTKDDLSRWVNGKPIDLFITATPDEHEAIVADGSPYVLTELETRLTGFPRHDRLLRLAERGRRDMLLVVPTWRRELLGAQGVGNRRDLLEQFWSSVYAVAWLELLQAPELAQLCARAGWQLCFVPHPNMQDYLGSVTLPAHVTARRFSEIDIQELLAASAAVVTDYSSLAFEAAYVRRPVVYYQFDRGDFFAGGHVYRQGRWSYERQGFGPVAETTTTVISALGTIADTGPDGEYLARMERTFPLRDGRCCERTTAAIRAITGSTQAAHS